MAVNEIYSFATLTHTHTNDTSFKLTNCKAFYRYKQQL